MSFEEKGSKFDEYIEKKIKMFGRFGKELQYDAMPVISKQFSTCKITVLLIFY